MGNVFHVQRFCLGRCVLLVHLKTALSSKQEHVRLLSGNLVYLMMEGNRDARKLLEAFLPKVMIFTCEWLLSPVYWMCSLGLCSMDQISVQVLIDEYRFIIMFY